jgi:hypothetical protein
MTPEEREARRLAEEEHDRQYAEMQLMRRMQIDGEFANAYRTYTTTSWTQTGISITERYRFDYDEFFNPPAMNPTPPTLNERYEAALQEADRCARSGNPRGQLTAIQTARNLRQEIQRLTSATII